MIDLRINTIPTLYGEDFTMRLLVRQLSFLGLEIERRLNASVSADTDISAPGASVPSLVVKAREDIEVAREVRRILADGNRATVSPSTP